MNNFLKKVCGIMALAMLPTGTLLGVAYADMGSTTSDAAYTGSVLTVNSTSLFIDIDDSFAKGYIESFALMGVVMGYGDGYFRPENPITRAEFLAITMNALHISVSGITDTPFEDIPTGEGAWILSYAERARQLGIVYGQTIQGKLKFRPNDSITRGEALIILLNAANISVDTSLKTTVFQDIPAYAEGVLIPYVERARELGIINGQMLGGILKFRPNDSITRAESVKIIMKASVL